VVCKITVDGKWLNGTAQRQDTLQLYAVDKRIVYRLLHRVTETYIQPCAHNATNISLSAQVISSIVAAAINTLVTASKDNCTVSLNDM
jgi:hypothetical protein